MICVLNKELNKIDYYLYLNNENSVKSKQLDNGDIICLNENGKLFLYKKKDIDEYLENLYKNFSDYLEPKNINIEKPSLFSEENIIRDYFCDVFGEEDFDNIYPHPPICINIFCNNFIFNFIDINTDKNKYLLAYGKKLFTSKNECYIFSTDLINIKNISNNNEVIFTSECLDKYLLKDFMKIFFIYNCKKNNKYYIGIMNIEKKQAIKTFSIDGFILDFGIHNNNLLICYYCTQNLPYIELNNVYHYYLEEFDIKNDKKIALRNILNSEEKKKNIILLINNDIIYLGESGSLSLFK